MCQDDGTICKICVDGFTMNEQNECKPTTCLVKHCASCDDDLTCKKCNAPYQLIQDNKCQLCELGTYYDEDDGSCASIFI